MHTQVFLALSCTFKKCKVLSRCKRTDRHCTLARSSRNARNRAADSLLRVGGNAWKQQTHKYASYACMIQSKCSQPCCWLSPVLQIIAEQRTHSMASPRKETASSTTVPLNPSNTPKFGGDRRAQAQIFMITNHAPVSPPAPSSPTPLKSLATCSFIVSPDVLQTSCVNPDFKR